MRVYIIRHADPDYENGTITPDGHLEAKALAERLAQVGIDHIYSSPLGRAIHTMEYTAERMGVKEYVIQEWMQEISGMQLKHPAGGSLMAWDVRGEDVLGKEPFPNHSNWHQIPCFDGVNVLEKFEEIQQHSDDFFRHHGYQREGGRYRCVRPNEEKIAVFCHGGFGLTWLAHLLQLPPSLVWAGFWLAPSSVTTILLDQRTQQWAVPRCIALGDTSHLYKENLEIKPRGIIANYY